MVDLVDIDPERAQIPREIIEIGLTLSRPF